MQPFFAGRAEVLTSFDGKYCSVLWPSAGVYALYATSGVDSTDSWRELGRGHAVSMAWAASTATLALLHVPNKKVSASLQGLWCITTCHARRCDCQLRHPSVYPQTYHDAS